MVYRDRTWMRERRKQQLGARIENGHLCNWAGCVAWINQNVWACELHWYKIPIDIRRRLWMNYKGAGIPEMQQSGEYIKAAKDAREYIANTPYEGVRNHVRSRF